MRKRSPEDLIEAATAGDRGALARLISVVERGGPEAREVGRLVYPRGGTAYTVGITGAPGAGKSSLTDRLIGVVRGRGLQIAVLAVDPSSPFTGGALLGDRVRMQEHATDAGVFIRSMATRGHVGGLSLAAPEAIRVLDAAGLPVVLVETVGVGQVEVEVAGAADTTVVVVNPGWGDSVQAGKAGLLEIADVFVVNKADRPGAQETERDLHHMLDMNMHMGEWRPPVLQTVASSGEGVEDVWAAVEQHQSHLESSGELDERREKRLVDEVREIVLHRLAEEAFERIESALFDGVRPDLVARRVDPYEAADRLLADE